MQRHRDKAKRRWRVIAAVSALEHFCSQSKQADALELAASELPIALQWLSLSQDRWLLTLHCKHCASMQLAHIRDDIIAV